MGAVVGPGALEGRQRGVVDVEAVLRVAVAEVGAQDLPRKQPTYENRWGWFCCRLHCLPVSDVARQLLHLHSPCTWALDMQSLQHLHDRAMCR